MPFRIEYTRGDMVESVHRVSVAVSDADGRLLAVAGEPGQETWWRSAAKPFQAMPLVAEGGADRFGLDERELALVCASHSSEPIHLAVTDGILRKIGCSEADLACGPHPPLSAAVAEEAMRSGTTITPRWSNCSGKHAGLLAQAIHGGWPKAGYHEADHPVQRRILKEVARWSGLDEAAIRRSVDGCNTVCFGLPLRNMAKAYARFGRSEDPAAARLRRAMLKHPELIAGTGRSCTEFMTAFKGALLAKVGAEGVYSAALPAAGLGIAIKVEDGDMRSAPIALYRVLDLVLQNIGGDTGPLGRLGRWKESPITNTRDLAVGQIRAGGGLRFS
ncbi:MAG: asparaginase [Gemmatimonadales bacterium]